MSDLDLSRYEGHTPEPWDLVVREVRWIRTTNGACLADLHGSDADDRLLFDAPKLLAEVKKLRAMHDATVRGAEQEIMELEGDIADLAVAHQQMREERDALAEALREVLTSLAAFSLNVNLSASLNAAKDSGWAALARAGRTTDE